MDLPFAQNAAKAREEGSFVVDVEGFEGPLDLLLDLARRQKVDLSKISVLALVEQYLEFIADQRLAMLGVQKIYGAKNPFSFMDLQDVQELTNFFERRVSAYQVAVAGDVVFNEAF